MSKQIKVVTEAEYGDGPVYVNDESVGQAGYFGSIQEMREAYEDRQQPLPGKVSGCYTVLFSLPRATEIINDALSNGEWHDGCDPDADDAALQAAIDAYNARQTECTWFVDDDVEVVLKASYAFPDDTSLASMTEEEKGAELRKAVASGWSEAEAQGTIWPSGTPDRCTETYPEYGQCRYHNGHAGPHRATRWDGGKTWSSASPPSPTTAPNACTDRHTARDVSEMPAPATPAPRCKCGDPTCQLWRDDIVCPHCSAALEAITADPEFEGRGGDMGEGHYADCPHGLAAMAGDILTGSLKIEDALVILARPAAPQGGEPGESRHLRALAEVTEQLAVSEKLNAGVVFLSLAVTPADARAIRSALASPPAGAPEGPLLCQSCGAEKSHPCHTLDAALLNTHTFDPLSTDLCAVRAALAALLDRKRANGAVRLNSTEARDIQLALENSGSFIRGARGAGAEPPTQPTSHSTNCACYSCCPPKASR